MSSLDSLGEWFSLLLTDPPLPHLAEPDPADDTEADAVSPVDIILMDVMMPERDGHATTAAIRGMPRYNKLPIIMVTAKAMAGDREKSLASGRATTSRNPWQKTSSSVVLDAGCSTDPHRYRHSTTGAVRACGRLSSRPGAGIVRGRVRVKAAPAPSALCTVIQPPCIVAFSCAIARPRPLPSV